MALEGALADRVSRSRWSAGGIVRLLARRLVAAQDVTHNAEKGLPADAEFDGKRHGTRWLIVLTGVSMALAGIRHSGDEPVYGAVAAGWVVAVTAAVLVARRWIERWEAEHGRELVRYQKSRWAKAQFYLHELPAGSGRFDPSHEREVVASDHS